MLPEINRKEGLSPGDYLGLSKPIGFHFSWIFGSVFLILLVMPVFRLATFNSLGGLPLGLVGLLLILARDVPRPARQPLLEHKHMLVPLAVTGFIYVVAELGDSTALQLIGLGLFSAVWLNRVFARGPMGGLLILLGLICLPVIFLQGSLLLSLQQLASVMASWTLDVARVAHVRQGVVLETVRGALFVEEACSGMQSLLAGLVVSQVYFCWHRRGLIFSLVGLSCCTAFLLLANCLRIFIIGWLYGDHDIDLTKGWIHELTGLAVYLLVLALLPSLSGLLEMIGNSFNRWHQPWLHLPDRHGARTSPVAPPPLKPWVAAQVLLSEFSVPLCATISVMATAAVAEAMIFRNSGPAVERVDTAKLPVLSRIELPLVLAGWQQDPAGNKSSVIEKFTLDQHIWTFHKGSQTAWVAAGLPYDELHPLRLCYLNRDWAITREGDVSKPGMAAFSYLELRSKEKTRAPMLVCYDNYDLSKNRYVGGPPDRIASRWSTLRARLHGKTSASAAVGTGPFCQVQVVQTGVTDHASASGVGSMELLAAARDYLADRLSNSTLK